MHALLRAVLSPLCPAELHPTCCAHVPAHVQEGAGEEEQVEDFETPEAAAAAAAAYAASRGQQAKDAQAALRDRLGY